MKLAYVAGPYTDERGHWFVNENIKRAAEVARALWGMGFAVICPHTNSANMDGTDIPYPVWIAGTLRMLEACDLVVVLPGWAMSKGTKGEIDHARSRSIPVYFWEEEHSTRAVGLLEVLATSPPSVRPLARREISVAEAAAIMGRHAAEKRRKPAASETILFPEAA